MIAQNTNNKILGILLVVSVAAISPLLPAAGLPGGLVYFVAVGSAILLNAQKKELNASVLSIIFIVYTICLLPAIYWGSLQRAVEPIYLLMSLILAMSLGKVEIKTALKYLTNFHVILLAGALFSFAYALLGGEPFFAIVNPDGRENFVLPLSLTNSFWTGLSRPSGIYDEPGTFSFFLCSLVTLRHLLGFDEKKSFYILLLGLFTLSLAHIIFLIVFLFSCSKRSFGVIQVLILCSLAGLFIFLSGNWAIFYAVFLIRFKIDPDGTLHGDNRSEGFFNAMEILKDHPETIIWGISDYYRNNPLVFSETFSDGLAVGGNPLNQLLQLGVGSLPYFLILLCLFITAFRKGRHNLVVLGFCLLLLQRDYVYVISYSLMVSLVLFAAIKGKRSA